VCQKRRYRHKIKRYLIIRYAFVVYVRGDTCFLLTLFMHTPFRRCLHLGPEHMKINLLIFRRQPAVAIQFSNRKKPIERHCSALTTPGAQK
jgi:hypothetical protein